MKDRIRPTGSMLLVEPITMEAVVGSGKSQIIAPEGQGKAAKLSAGIVLAAGEGARAAFGKGSAVALALARNGDVYPPAVTVEELVGGLVVVFEKSKALEFSAFNGVLVRAEDVLATYLPPKIAQTK